MLAEVAAALVVLWKMLFNRCLKFNVECSGSCIAIPESVFFVAFDPSLCNFGNGEIFCTESGHRVSGNGISENSAFFLHEGHGDQSDQLENCKTWRDCYATYNEMLDWLPRENS